MLQEGRKKISRKQTLTSLWRPVNDFFRSCSSHAWSLPSFIIFLSVTMTECIGFKPAKMKYECCWKIVIFSIAKGWVNSWERPKWTWEIKMSNKILFLVDFIVYRRKKVSSSGLFSSYQNFRHFCRFLHSLLVSFFQHTHTLSTIVTYFNECWWWRYMKKVYHITLSRWWLFTEICIEISFSFDFFLLLL